MAEDGKYNSEQLGGSQAAERFMYLREIRKVAADLLGDYIIPIAVEITIEKAVSLVSTSQIRYAPRRSEASGCTQTWRRFLNQYMG